MDNPAQLSSQRRFADAPADPTSLGEDNFRHLAEALPEIVFTATPSGELDYFSHRWGEYGGLSPDDPEYLDWAPRLHPDDLEDVANTWAEAVKRGEVYEREFRLRSATGKYSWFHTRVIPVRDQNFKILKWYGVTTDIDQRKKMEIELRRHSERMDEFVAMLGHELRNPLAAIRTSYEVFGRPEVSEEQRDTAFGILGQQLDHLTRLVDDTLDISRLSSGKLRLIRCPLELKQLITECCAGYQEQAKARTVSLAAKISGEEVWVDGDDARITQCLSNLLDNALKFTGPGGTIEVGLRIVDDAALLEVKDSGVGMREEEIEQVFRPFKQGDGASQMSTEGLGLGLTVVDKLISMHGGRVTISSEGKDKGTTFSIHLPLAEPPPQEVRPELHETLTQTLKILILEDNESVAASLQMFLELEGHEVQIASDGKAALDFLDNETPEAVISDLTLPGHLSGWDVAEKISGSYPLPHRPYLIALSGHAQPHFQERSLEAGFDEHLAKPPTPDKLREALSRAVLALSQRRTSAA